MSIRRTLAVVILCAILQTLLFCAFAEDTEPTPVPYPEDGSIRYTLYTHDAEILRLKDRLLEYGYYPSLVSTNDIEGIMLDEITLDAIREACAVNDLPYSGYGITHVAWDSIMGGLIVPHPTPTPEPTAVPTSDPSGKTSEGGYPHIAWGDTVNTNAIISIQALLDDLGYLSNYTPGVYSWELRDAIDLFCKFNKIAYDQSAPENNGISPIFQQMLFNEDKQWTPFTTPEPVIEVTPTPEPSVEPGKLDKIRTYFLGTVSVGGIGIPTLALWILCLLIIILCIVMAVHFFVPSKKSSENSSSAVTRFSASRSPAATHVDFYIECDGGQWTHAADLGPAVKIGRNIGSFPLQLSDTQVSRKHCEIYNMNGSIMLRDYSGNGTLINGRMCHHTEYVLTSGDVLEFGRHRVTVIF